MAKARVTKITRQEAVSYDRPESLRRPNYPAARRRLIPNGLGVTTLALVNGRGAYQANRGAKKAKATRAEIRDAVYRNMVARGVPAPAAKKAVNAAYGSSRADTFVKMLGESMRKGRLSDEHRRRMFETPEQRKKREREETRRKSSGGRASSAGKGNMAGKKKKKAARKRQTAASAFKGLGIRVMPRRSGGVQGSAASGLTEVMVTRTGSMRGRTKKGTSKSVKLRRGVVVSRGGKKGLSVFFANKKGAKKASKKKSYKQLFGKQYGTIRVTKVRKGRVKFGPYKREVVDGKLTYMYRTKSGKLAKIPLWAVVGARSKRDAGKKFWESKTTFRRLEKIKARRASVAKKMRERIPGELEFARAGAAQMVSAHEKKLREAADAVERDGGMFVANRKKGKKKARRTAAQRAATKRMIAANRKRAAKRRTKKGSRKTSARRTSRKRTYKRNASGAYMANKRRRGGKGKKRSSAKRKKKGYISKAKRSAAAKKGWRARRAKAAARRRGGKKKTYKRNGRRRYTRNTSHMRANRRRGRGRRSMRMNGRRRYRRNAGLSVVWQTIPTAAKALVGFGVHRGLTRLVGGYLVDRVSQPIARIGSAALVALVGIPAAYAVAPQHAAPVAVGMGLSALYDLVSTAIRMVTPATADMLYQYTGLMGFGDIPERNITGYQGFGYLPGQYAQAAAGFGSYELQGLNSYELQGMGGAGMGDLWPVQAAAGMGDLWPVQAAAGMGYLPGQYAQAAAGLGTGVASYELSGPGVVMEGITPDDNSIEQALNAADGAADPYGQGIPSKRIWIPNSPEVAVQGLGGSGIFASTSL